MVMVVTWFDCACAIYTSTNGEPVVRKIYIFSYYEILGQENPLTD